MTQYQSLLEYYSSILTLKGVAKGAGLMILVSPAAIKKGSSVEPVRCPLCNRGRLCDAVTYNDVIRTILSPEWNIDTALILKCPLCKGLSNIATLEIEY